MKNNHQLFAIIKYFVQSFGYESPVFEKIEQPNREGKIISKEKAFEIIEKYNMIKVFQNYDGIVWELPSMDFYLQNKGFYRKIEEKERIKEMLFLQRQKEAKERKKRIRIEKRIKQRLNQ